MDMPPYQFHLADVWVADRGVAEHGGLVYSAHDIRPAIGPMASYLGRRHSPAELVDEDQGTDGPEGCLVRAWPVPRLVGAALASPDEIGLASALETLLWDRLPGIDWRVPEVSAGPLRKYGIFHTAVAAPVDQATGQAMALEIYGDVTVLDGRARAGDWWQMRGIVGDLFKSLAAPIAGSLEIRIEVATYANVSYPGIGVPFYM